MSIEIKKLFDRNRFLGGPSLLILILYAPLGVLLLILRVFISLQLCLASFILPTGTITRKFVLRIMYSVLGIVIQEKDSDKKDEKCRLLISNHVTPFDHLAVSIVHPCVSVSVYDLPSLLSSLLCYQNFNVPQGPREISRVDFKGYLNQADAMPLLLHPEDETTNGEAAVMKYGSWAFDVDKSVLAVGIKVYRFPILYIAPSVIGGSWMSDAFYLLFSPVTVFTIKYIGKLTREDSETAEEFATRVQNTTANAIGLEASNHTVADKVEYVKRVSREEVVSSNVHINPEIQVMATQVKEVLPYLPIEVIKRDLVRTRNVDMTITNFLEGNVPEPITPPFTQVNESPVRSASQFKYPTHSPIYHTSSSPSPVSSNLHTSTQTSSSYSNLPHPSWDDNQSLNMAAKTFGKSATERVNSFEERKGQLIEKARQRYLMKKRSNLTENKC